MRGQPGLPLAPKEDKSGKVKGEKTGRDSVMTGPSLVGGGVVNMKQMLILLLSLPCGQDEIKERLRFRHVLAYCPAIPTLSEGLFALSIQSSRCCPSAPLLFVRVDGLAPTEQER